MTTARPRKLSGVTTFATGHFQSGWRDLNPRPLRPERSALPSCATPRFKRRQPIAPAVILAKLRCPRQCESALQWHDRSNFTSVSAGLLRLHPWALPPVVVALGVDVVVATVVEQSDHRTVVATISVSRTNVPCGWRRSMLGLEPRTCRSTTPGRNDGSASGRPMPSMQDDVGMTMSYRTLAYVPYRR